MQSVFFTRPNPLNVRQQESALYWMAVWLPTIFAMGVIAMESTSKFSAGNTSSWLRPIFERWVGEISDAHWELGHHVLRKMGHLSGYGFVALTFLRAWLHTLARRLDLTAMAWRLQSCVAAVASTSVIAIMDEWHQTFIPSRTGAVSDVGIDTLGGMLMCAVVWLLFWQGSAVEVAASEEELREMV